jgi:hypothetical protein
MPFFRSSAAPRLHFGPRWQRPDAAARPISGRAIFGQIEGDAAALEAKTAALETSITRMSIVLLDGLPVWECGPGSPSG